MTGRPLSRGGAVLPIATGATFLLILAATLTADAPHRGSHWLRDHEWGPIALGMAVARALGIHRAEVELLVHLGLFALFGALIIAVLRSGVIGSRLRQWPQAVMATLVLAAALGAATELGQMLVANRSASLLDWAVDLAGTLAGIALLVPLTWTFRGLAVVVRSR